MRELESAAGIDAPQAAGADVAAAYEARAGAAQARAAQADDAEASAAQAGTEQPGAARVAADEVGAVPVADQVHSDAGIWSKALRRRTAGLWAVWFCINLSYYGAFIWIPTLLVDRGFTLTQSFSFTLIITLAQLPGYAVAAWLIEVLGRRWTLTVLDRKSVV